MIDAIAMIFVSLLLLSLIIFVFICAWWMFEQTDLGQLYIEKKREQMEDE